MRLHEAVLVQVLVCHQYVFNPAWNGLQAHSVADTGTSVHEEELHYSTIAEISWSVLASSNLGVDGRVTQVYT